MDKNEKRRNWPLVLFFLLFVSFPILWGVPLRLLLGNSLWQTGAVYGAAVAIGSTLLIVGGLWGRVWLQGIFAASLLGTVFLFSMTWAPNVIRIEYELLAACFTLPAMITLASTPMFVFRLRYGWNLSRLPNQLATPRAPIELGDMFLVTASLASIFILAKFSATLKEWTSTNVYSVVAGAGLYGLVLSTVYLAPLLWFFFRSKHPVWYVVIWNAISFVLLPAMVSLPLRALDPSILLTFTVVMVVGGGFCCLFLFALKSCGYLLSAYATQASEPTVVDHSQSEGMLGAKLDQQVHQPSLGNSHYLWAALFFAIAVSASGFSVYLDSSRSDDDGRLFAAGQHAIEAGGHIKVLKRKLYELKVGADADDQVVRHYEHLEDVENLVLAGSKITDAVAGQLSRFSNLNAIDVSGTRVTDAFVEELIILKRGKYLSKLSVADTQISREGRLRILTQLSRNLTHLDVGGLRITDGELSELPYRSINLGLRDNQITDAGLKDYMDNRPSRHIGRLDLSGNPLDASGLAGKSIRIQALVLDRTNVNDQTIASHLSGLSISNLVLRNTRLTDAALPSLSKLTGVSGWELGDGNFTDQGLANLSSTIPITQLKLSGKQFTGTCFKTWMPGVRILSMQGSGVTDEALGYIANFPSLTYLDLSDTAISDEGLKQIQKSSFISKLNLTGTKITADGLKKVQLRNCSAIVVGLNQFSLDELKALRAVLPIVTDINPSEE